MFHSRVPTGSLVLDRLVCHIWDNYNVYYTSMFCSTYCTVATALERYMKIVHPLWYVASGTNKMILWLIFTAWVAGFATAIPAIFFVNIQNGRCCWSEMSFVSTVVLSVFDFIVIYAAPVLTLLYCYIRIVYTLSVLRKPSATSADHNNTTTPAIQIETTTSNNSLSNITATENVSMSVDTDTNTVPEPRTTTTEGKSSQVAIVTRPAAGNESRNTNIKQAYFTTVRVGLLVAIIYFVCWSVDQVRVVWGYFDVSNERQMFGFAAMFLVNLNCLLNPLSYVFSFAELRSRLWARVSKCLFRNADLERRQEQ